MGASWPLIPGRARHRQGPSSPPCRWGETGLMSPFRLERSLQTNFPLEQGPSEIAQLCAGWRGPGLAACPGGLGLEFPAVTDSVVGQRLGWWRLCTGAGALGSLQGRRGARGPGLSS